MPRLTSARTATVLVSVISSALIGGGGLIAVLAFMSGERPAPYVYEIAAGAETPEPVRAMAQEIAGAKAETLVVKLVDQQKALATAQIVETPGDGKVIVGWTSAIGEPLLRSDISSEEEQKLAAALKKHLPAGGVAFAMPALSRRLSVMARAAFPLAGADDSSAIRVPEPWLGARGAILQTERRWLRSSPDAKADRLFADLIDALLSEDKYGVARLQVMSGGRESYLILHVRDAFDVGIVAPNRISVGLRDFPAGGQVHDTTKLVKAWVAEEKRAAYAVLQQGPHAVRAYYLGEAKDKSSLLGQLLPFDAARLGLVTGATLVFQYGGYWVYRIAGAI